MSIVYYLLVSPAPEVAHEVRPLQGHGEGVLGDVLLLGGGRGVLGGVPLLRGDPLAPGLELAEDGPGEERGLLSCG